MKRAFKRLVKPLCFWSAVALLLGLAALEMGWAILLVAWFGGVLLGEWIEIDVLGRETT